ncbi:MAG: 50S ribosomal protein L7ae [Lachnospiraceae bacterium]|nr:50S ribosomal protein L7ae [Lachnospiraceae bacterium]
MQKDRILSMLGLAAKAGKIVSGEFSTEKAIKSGKAFLVIVSEEASENTKKIFRDKCSFYEIPIYLYASKEMLGNAIGRQFRASLAVLDPGFANSLEEKLKIAVKTE